jgi:hypothetical protein
METTFKLTIEIETEIETGLKANFEVNEILFTSFDYLFKSEDIINKYKLAMKKLNNKFNMLTITLLKYQSGYYNNNNIIFSCRYVNRYSEVTRSNFNGNSYNNFIASDIKEIKKDIEQSIEIGNRNFIETIKKNVA